MDINNIFKKLNNKNITIYELLSCPHCGSTDIKSTDTIEEIYYYRENGGLKYLEKYEGQKPIGVEIIYTCNNCDTDFMFTGKLTNTKIEILQ